MALPVILPRQGMPTQAGAVRADEAALAQPYARLAAGAARASDQLLDIGERQKKVTDTIELAKASSEAAQELDDYRITLDKDGDFATKAERFKAKSEEIKAKHSARFGGETAARFSAAYDQLSSGMQIAVRHEARRDEVQNGIVALDTANDGLLTRAANAPNDVARDGYLKQVNDNLKGAMESGILTAAQHEQRRRHSLGKFEEATAIRLIRTNPGAAIQALDAPDKYTYMDPVRREMLKVQAQGRLETLGAQARLDARIDGQDLIQSYQQGIAPEDADARLAKLKAVDPRLAAKVETERNVFGSVQTFRDKPLTEQATILKGYEEKHDAGGLGRGQRLEYERMLQVHQRTMQAFVNDAWTASMATSRTVRELNDRAANMVEDPQAATVAREAALDWQARNGVPAFDRAVVSKGQAKQMAQQLATLDGPAFDAKLRELKDQYGAHFEILRRQLAEEGKASGTIGGFATALELPDTPAGVAARSNLIEAGKIKHDDLSKVYGNPDDAKTARTAIDNALADFRSSVGGSAGGMSTVARYRDDAERLAASFVLQGKKPKEAGILAVEQLVGQHYAFVPDSNGGTVRVPRVLGGAAVPIDTVRDNLSIALERLPKLELQVPHDPTPGADAKVNAEAFARRVQAYGRWMNLQGGQGAVLTYEAAGRIQPVLTKDGKPVTVMFNEPLREKRPIDVPGPAIQ